ncbi:MAG: DUF58 domain-containing protein [Acidobacteriia bacterium]|jgi:uncharacterized protein (DUF58 family)|nr:DUF58 domain-containing protein [Terriglobia bacterium]
MRSAVQQWWASADRAGWRSFAGALAALGVALLLALYSSAAAEGGQKWRAWAAALAALGLAGWVAARIVPGLARRTALRWLTLRLRYRLTREGTLYLALLVVVLLAALNTANNLLFLILAAMLAGLLISGVVSRAVLAGVELRLELPEHIFAGQPVQAVVVLRNNKPMLPSFSLRVVGETRSAGNAILTRPVYFPYLARGQAARQAVELRFARRGRYRQDALALQTRFPFGFLEKTLRVEMAEELLVYPRVEPTEEFYEVLPLLSGELESYTRGRGHDLYGIRDSQPSDSARFVDWKASARTGALKVREFTREDERRVLLVLDPRLHGEASDAVLRERFERAVQLAAGLAWHFYEIDAELAFHTAGFSTPLARAGEIIYPVLRALALIEPLPATAAASVLEELPEAHELYKIILTSQPRGTIPTRLWTSSYLVFFDAL